DRFFRLRMRIGFAKTSESFIGVDSHPEPLNRSGVHGDSLGDVDRLDRGNLHGRWRISKIPRTLKRMENALLQVLIFWMLTTPHEFAHAWVAMKLGDDTPVLHGRVTLNPLAHVDWMGTVILPLVMSILGGFFIGWGKPVSTNPSKLRWGWNGMALVAMAGPASNVIFAIVLL